VNVLKNKRNDNKNNSYAKLMHDDFSQSFSQLRHYDTAYTSMMRFAFTGYTAVFGAVFTIYVDMHQDHSNISIFLATLMGVVTLMGLLVLATLVRNRIYYVTMARHLNDYRKFIIEKKPYGFTPCAEIYADPKKPAFFHFTSSHIVILHFVAFLNALATFTCFFFLKVETNFALNYTIPAVVFAVQIIGYVYVLARRDRKEKKNGT